MSLLLLAQDDDFDATSVSQMPFALTPQQVELRDRAVEAGAEFRDEVAAWDATDQVPYRNVLKRIADYGLLGLAMPTEFGGQGLTVVDYLVLGEALFRNAQHWVFAEPV